MQQYKDLVNLNANRARVAVLDKQIPQLQKLAAKLQNDVAITVRHYDGDDACGIHATGSHGDPTMRRAMCDLPGDVAQLLEDIRQLTIERHRTAARIDMAESALAFLSERERLVVELRSVEGMSWADVVDAVYDRTGDMIGEKTVRRTYDRACVKIAPFFPNAGDSEKKRVWYRSVTA